MEAYLVMGRISNTTKKRFAITVLRRNIETHQIRGEYTMNGTKFSTDIAMTNYLERLTNAMEYECIDEIFWID